MSPSTLSLLSRQHVLIDTNILIDAAKHGDLYSGFFKSLNNAQAWSVLDPVVNIEFLRGIKKADTFAMKEFLSGLFGKDRIELFVNDETFRTAQNIARLCHLTDNKSISLGDCLIAAQLAKYGGESRPSKMYLATQNHKDFPACLFRRLDVEIITLGDGSIKTIGIYSFNETAYKKLVERCL